jgi:hypothetical protein
VLKPSPTAPLADKARFIQDKYAARAYVATGPPRERAQAALWDAVSSRDVRAAAAALAAGADAAAAYRTPRAQKLVWEAAARTGAIEGRGAAAGGGGSSRGSSFDGARPASGGDDGSGSTVCGSLTVLHLAATGGDIAMTEFLLQNGARWGATDAHGRTPLVRLGALDVQGGSR